MGIFDIFTGDPMKEAAEQQRQFLAGEKAQGRGDIEGGLTNATGYVNTGALAGRDALKLGYNTSTGAINTGADQALNYLGTGTNQALASLRTAGDSFAPLSALGQKYGQGTDLYLNALGVNGPAGNAAAKAAFTPGLGYNFNLDQGLDAITRARNATGQLAGGNTDREVQKYGAGLASQEYDKWMGQLQGLVNPELQATGAAATGLAGVNTNMANLYNSAGTNQANIASTRGGMLADLGTRYGTNMAGFETGAANTLAGLETNAAGQKVGLTTSLAPAYSKTYSDAAAAEMAGSGNLWNLGLQGAKLLAGGF